MPLSRMKSAERLLVFLTLALLAIDGGQAQTNVSRSPQWESWGPRIAVDNAGHVHVVWLELYSSNSGDVFYSYYDAATRNWSSPFNLSQSGEVYTPSFWATDIAVDASKRVYVVWVERNRVKLRIKDGTWGSEILVNSGGLYYDSPRLGVSPEGDIHIVWWTDDGTIWAKARVGGVWEGTQAISPGQARSKFPDIAICRNLVAACWMQRGPGEAWYQIAYSQRSRTRGASWTASKVVAPSDNDQQHGAIALDYLDRAHIVCTPELYTATRQVYYVTGTLAGFEQSVPISSIDNIHYPFIVEAGGNLYVCWQVGGWGDGVGVFYNIKRDGSWTGEKMVPGSSGATYSDLAVTQDESLIYFVWDSRGEIYVTSTGQIPPDNRAPVANFTYYPQKGEAPLTVTFDGSLSYDPDGTIVRYDWDFGDGQFGSGVVVSHTYYYPGIYSVRLTVTDNKGKTGFIIKIVEVFKRNEPPVADFTFSPTTGLFPLTVSFDASASYDPDGYITRYEWSFGDGGGAEGKIVQHRYSIWGLFTIKLTVYDNLGASSVATKSLEVFRLYQPLNIRWETHLDEGLFLTRYVTDIRWESNPENDRVAAITKIPLASYRIYRKKVGEADSAYRFIGEVNSQTFFFRDSNVGGVNLYVYTVTARSVAGHESPINVTLNFLIPEDNQPTRNDRIKNQSRQNQNR